MASSRTVLDAGAALGAASLVISVGALLATHAPGINEVADSSPGTQLAGKLRTAELAAGALVVMAGATAALLMRETWPLYLSVAATGVAIGIYEVTLRHQG
jgi:hypothetical protein